MDYNEMSAEAYKFACHKGFWDNVRSHDHYVTLVITELCEAIEADRKKIRANQLDYTRSYIKNQKEAYEAFIRGSIEEELADSAIRLLSFAGHLEIDFFRLTPCRYYRVFTRFSFTENAYALIKGLSRDHIIIERRVHFGLEYLRMWSEQLGIDLAFHIDEKMKYNLTREPMHSKVY